MLHHIKMGQHYVSRNSVTLENSGSTLLGPVLLLFSLTTGRDGVAAHHMPLGQRHGVARHRQLSRVQLRQQRPQLRKLAS